MDRPPHDPGSGQPAREPDHAPQDFSEPGSGTETASRDAPPQRVEVRPRPRVRGRIRRSAIALAGLGLLTLLMLLTLQFSRETLSAARDGRPSPPAPPPVDLEQIERFEPAESPRERAPSLRDPRPALPPVAPPSPPPWSQALEAALRARLVHAAPRSAASLGAAADEPRSPSPPDWRSMLGDARADAVGAAPPGLPVQAGPYSQATASNPTSARPTRNLLPAPEWQGTLITAPQPPPTPYLLRAGTWVPAVLSHRVLSDQPGLLRAVVTRDVHDSLTGRHLLVPRGTVLLGAQGDLPSIGQDRLAVLWTTLQLPDGCTLDLDGREALPSAARDGTAGLAGRTRHHWGRRYGAAVLLSLVGAGLQLSQPERSLDRAVSPGETAASALGLELGRVSQELLRQYSDLPPTVALAPGARVHAVLTRDLAFRSPYSHHQPWR